MTTTTTLDGDGVTLGVVGGGQLGRMLAEAASPLGVELVVLDPTPDCPASAVARDQIVADFDDAGAVADLAERSDVLTYEIELADPALLGRVSDARGVAVYPSPDTLRTIQDKLQQKRAFAKRNIPVPAFRAVADADDVRDAADEFGYPLMLKAREGGYDGRGNVPVTGPDEAEAALDAVGGDAMVEAFVDYARELAVMGVKGSAETDTYPVVETVHREEILRETVAPARTDDATIARARDVATDVLDVLDGRGVYGIEMFETQDGEVLVNEVAPRPHNSGHYTIEGAYVSQFEQHVRAVVDLPLGDTDLRAPTALANVLGDVADPEPGTLHGVDDVLSDPAVSMHWYGKREARPLRKMGHVTSVAREDESVEDALDRVEAARDTLTFDP